MRAAGSPGTCGRGFRGVRLPDKPPDALTEALRARTGHPGLTVTPTTPAVTPTETTDAPTAPPVEIAAATTASSATTEETTPVTETVTVEPTTVDVKAEILAPTSEVAP